MNAAKQELIKQQLLNKQKQLINNSKLNLIKQINKIIDYKTIIINIMDNQSNNSQAQSDIYTITYQKPNNNKKFIYKGLTISSDFPGGNLQSITFKDQFLMDGRYSLVIQFYSNSDTNSDIRDKAWFYFVIDGIRDSKNVKYSQFVFTFKNANIYRKFIKQKKYKPYIVVKEQPDKLGSQWKSIYISSFDIQQNQVIQAQFTYIIHPGIDKVAFASNIPYNIRDLQFMNSRIIDHLDTYRNSQIYYHRQIIAQSVDKHPVYMFTITASMNIASYSNRQVELWPYKGNRPYCLKNKPQIVITARVHPSQISSSYCVQAIIQQLTKNNNFQLLIQMFIFRIIPMMNPDGVQHGYYRLDNYFQNLNRFYGYSDPIKTPSVYAVQQLITNLRQKSKLFMFVDIHGHNSPKPSFMFGNYSSNFYHTLQNKTFVKIMEVFNQQIFSSLECQFSKKNMSIKQKHDQHSKQASARVFAYQGISTAQNSINNIKSQLSVEHSYTLEVHPYISSNPNSNVRKKQIYEKQASSPTNFSATQLTSLNSNFIRPTGSSILKQFKNIATNFLLSILQILGVNNYLKLSESEDCKLIRKRCFKQLVRLPQFCDRSRKQRQKQINKQIFQRYYQKWNLIPTYKQYLAKILQTQFQKQVIQLKLKQCPIHQFFEETQTKKNSLNNYSKRFSKLSTYQIKSKQKTHKQQQNVIEKIQSQLNNLTSQQRRFNKNDNDSYLIQQNQKKNYPITIVAHEGRDSVEMKIMESMQRKYKQLAIGNPISLKSYSTNSNEQKRGHFLVNRNISELQKKVKRLIFKHKTDMQNRDYSSSNHNKIKIELQISSLLEQSVSQQKLKNKQLLFQHNNVLNKILEPLSSSKNKNKKLITEFQRNEQQRKMNQFIFRHKKSQEKIIVDRDIKTTVISSQNPKIKELIRKLQFGRKQQRKNQGLSDNDDNSSPQVLKLKSSKSIVPNIAVLKSKKLKTQANHEKTQNKMAHSLSNNCIVYEFNNNLTSNLNSQHRQKASQQIIQLSEQEINKSSRRLPGIYWTATPKSGSQLKKKQIQKQRDKDFTLEKLKVNDINFTDEAKQTIKRNKKTLRTIQQLISR